MSVEAVAAPALAAEATLDYAGSFNRGAEMRKALAGLVFAVVVAGCGGAKDSTPPAAASSAPPAATPAAAATPAGPAIPVSTDPMPALPAFAAALIGKPLADSGITEVTTCVGNADSITTRYSAPAPGAGLFGWGWNTAAKAPYADYLVLNHGNLVRGAGVGGASRPDVAQVRKDVTSDLSGWSASFSGEPGEYTVWAYDPKAKTACKLGSIVVP